MAQWRLTPCPSIFKRERGSHGVFARMCVHVCEWHFYKPGDERSDKPLPLPDCSLQLHLTTPLAVCVTPSLRGVFSMFVWDCLSLCHLGLVSPNPLKVCVSVCMHVCVCVLVTNTMSIYYTKVCMCGYVYLWQVWQPSYLHLFQFLQALSWTCVCVRTRCVCVGQDKVDSHPI